MESSEVALEPRTRSLSRAAFLTRYGVLAAMVATFATFCVLSPDAFSPSLTMKAILQNVTPLLILVPRRHGRARHERLRPVDRREVTLLGTIAVLLLSTAHVGLPYRLAICSTIVAGVGIGLFNGVMIAYAGAPSFIFTLAMGTFFTGVQRRSPTETRSTRAFRPATQDRDGVTAGDSNVVYVGLASSS